MNRIKETELLDQIHLESQEQYQEMIEQVIIFNCFYIANQVNILVYEETPLNDDLFVLNFRY